MDKTENCELIIFTTFDSSLFNEKDESYQSVISIIQKLQDSQIPLITVTDQSHKEIEDLRRILCLKSSLIVEHGSAVLIPEQSSEFAITEAAIDGEYYVKQLGCSYIEARAGLKVIQSTVRINNLKGFGDLDETEIQSLIGLSLKKAKQAKTREFSEIFVTPQGIDTQKIASTAEEFGFKVIMNNSLSCLVGREASIKTAIQWLKDHYQPSDTSKIVTVGLSNSSDNLEMLEAVDIPIVIARQEEINSQSNQKWRTTQASGLAGWVEAINAIFDEYYFN